MFGSGHAFVGCEFVDLGSPGSLVRVGGFI